MDATKISYEALSHFRSKRLYHHPFFKNCQYTRGIQYLGQNGAHWLINDILAYQQEVPEIQQCSLRDDLQFWIVEVSEEDEESVFLRCEDSTNKVLFSRAYHDVDFPLPKLTLYLDDAILMLNLEYPEYSNRKIPKARFPSEELPWRSSPF